MWFSILYNSESGSYNTKFAFSSHPYIGINNDGGLLTAAGNAFGFHASGSTMKAIMHDNSDSSSTSGSTLALTDDTTYLIVGKIEWNANGTDDDFYLFNVTDVNSEPANGSAFSTRSADLDQSNFTWVAYWETSDSQIDEIRFGTTFDAVMGR